MTGTSPSSFATAINNHQDVVGYAYEPAPEHAFLWTRGAKVNIGVPPGGQDFFPVLRHHHLVAGQGLLDPHADDGAAVVRTHPATFVQHVIQRVVHLVAPPALVWGEG